MRSMKKILRNKKKLISEVIPERWNSKINDMFFFIVSVQIF